VLTLLTIGGAETISKRSRSYDFGGCIPEVGVEAHVYPVDIVSDFPFTAPFYIK
jgi:hypothetical protein